MSIRASITGLFLSLTLLSGCGRLFSERQETSSSTSRQSSTSSPSTSNGSTTAQETDSQSASVETRIIQRDSYYSVMGKYGDEIIIVNKKHPLAADYAPGEDPQAQSAIWKLIADMQALGYAISSDYSGFRSYDYQTSLYNSFVARDGQEATDRYSARPGYSEHQTGLAFDLIDASGQLLEEPEAVDWLRHHAHNYGFIVRYLPGKEDITGYMAESWHLRYIGREAQDIYKSGLTLEEYFDVAGGGYDQ